MNLADLQYEIDKAIATCEAEGVDPESINVNMHYQPTYPLWGGLANVGFIVKDNRYEGGEPTVELALAITDSRNGYSSSAAWDCDTSSLKPEIECYECGWVVDYDLGGCHNKDCSEFHGQEG